jgi:hypothetical protein
MLGVAYPSTNPSFIVQWAGAGGFCSFVSSEIASRSATGESGPASTKVREKAGVKGRWHDNRHTLVTELAESGAGDEVIMGIAGHVSRAMLARYSHVRMEAKRRTLDEIAARQRKADEKRQQEIAPQQVGITSQSAVVQQSYFHVLRLPPKAIPNRLNADARELRYIQALMIITRVEIKWGRQSQRRDLHIRLCKSLL